MIQAPVSIQLRKKSGLLVLVYSGGAACELNAEFLRVHSPSAEVRGHGKGKGVLQTGKRKVGLTGLELIGSYAIRLTFDDGHDSGIFSWNYLHELCTRQDAMWRTYLEKLEAAGASRDALPADTQVITIQPMKQPPS